MKPKSILCIGAALNDLLLQESETFLKSTSREKGGMTMVDSMEIEKTLSATSLAPASAPGGSACNTCVGLAQLGSTAHFLGKRGNDAAGQVMEQKLKSLGVQTHLLIGEDATGRVLSIITPDAQRTMLTHLGAAATLSPDDITDKDFAGMDLVHLEGYLLFNNPFFMKCVELAKKSGAKLSLDLASFEVVRATMPILPDLLKNSIDLIIANEDEAQAYTGKSPEASLEIFAAMAEIAVVKLGANGVLAARGSERANVSVNKVAAIDTTGAGDLWASGFIHGLGQGKSLEDCCRLGNRTGSSVVQVLGAHIPPQLWQDIRTLG